jgi:hypothetical protein
MVRAKEFFNRAVRAYEQALIIELLRCDAAPAQSRTSPATWRRRYFR